MITEIKPFEVMEILARAQELEKLGEKVIHLEIGEPDFDTPEKIRNAAISAIKEGFTHYTNSQGIEELREKLAEHLNAMLGVDTLTSEIIITGGVSPALLFALQTIVDRGDEIIITDPTYPCYPNFIKIVGGKIKRVELNKEKNYSFNIDKLSELISKKTGGILLNSPLNPTGTYLNEKELKAIVEIAEDYNSYIICDEIYSGLVYDRERSPSILQQGYDKAIMLDGFSKLYAMTGWRIGYAIANKDIIRGMTKLQQNFYICPSSIAQKAAIAALECKKEVEEMKKEFDKRRRFVFNKLCKIEGIKVSEPKGAYYIFPDISSFSQDSHSFAKMLLEKTKVALTPGSAFGRSGEGHIRISYANSLEALKEGIERLKEFIYQLPSQTPP